MRRTLVRLELLHHLAGTRQFNTPVSSHGCRPSTSRSLCRCGSFVASDLGLELPLKTAGMLTNIYTFTLQNTYSFVGRSRLYIIIPPSRKSRCPLKTGFQHKTPPKGLPKIRLQRHRRHCGHDGRRRERRTRLETSGGRKRVLE